MERKVWVRVWFCHIDCLSLLPMRHERIHVTDYLIGVDQQIPDSLIEITFLVKVKTAVRLGIKSRFDILSTTTSDAILGYGCSLEHKSVF